jgi:hypothetical protein
MDILISIVLCVCFLMLGNHLADHATLKDCATTGEAKMLGGGTIKCEVKKEVQHD